MGCRFVAAIFISLYVVGSYAEPETKVSLNEIIDATLTAKFDKIFVGDPKEASALDMLKYSIKETTIEPKYLTKVFYDALGVNSDEGLDQFKYKLEKAVDMMNLIIKHFQSAPKDAGRPSASSEEKKDEL